MVHIQVASTANVFVMRASRAFREKAAHCGERSSTGGCLGLPSLEFAIPDPIRSLSADQCFNVTCTDNASCLEGVCLCDDGFEGNPAEGCTEVGKKGWSSYQALHGCECAAKLAKYAVASNTTALWACCDRK